MGGGDGVLGYKNNKFFFFMWGGGGKYAKCDPCVIRGILQSFIINIDETQIIDLKERIKIVTP